MGQGWTEAEIQDMRGRLIEAKRQGVWLSAIEARMFLGLLTWWQRVSTTGWRRPNQGRLETIAEARAKGITEIYVICDAACSRADRRLKIADLYMPPGRQPLPDTACFLDIPNLCRFRCVRCGSRRVRVMPVWPAGPGMIGSYGQVRSNAHLAPPNRRGDE